VTEDDKQRASHALYSALEKCSQTFGSLFPIANSVMGYAKGDQSAPGYRFADKWLQKKRRAGHIRLISKARGWELTDAGRAQVGGQS
jgi:hypothetical protein